MPTIPPNNTSGLYGIDSSPVIVDSGDISVGNIYAAGNATVEGNLTVGGTIYGNVVGNVIGNLVVPGSNTEVLFNQDGNAGASSNLTFNTDTSVLDVNGNVSANYFIGDGSQLTGLPASYGNSNVSAYLASGTDTANIITTGNISGQYILGNGAFLTGVAASYGNSNVSAYLASGTDTANIITTGNITGGNLTTGGNVIPGGIKTDNYYYANGTPISFAGTYGNSNVDAHLAAFGSNTLSTTGNVTAGYFIGNGSLLTNINAGNIIGSYGDANVANFLASGFGSNTITTTGNITGGNIIGNGQYLTNLPGGNVSGQVANALVAGTVYTAAQPNITSVGTLTSLNVSGNAVIGGNLTVNGNTIYTNITELNVQDPIISQGRGPNNTPLVSNDGKDRGEQFWYYTSTEKSAFSGYDNSAGKMLLATDVSIANEIVTVNSLGNVVAGNLEPTSVSASGNVTGSYISGNGSLLTSLTGANITGTVANATYATSAGTATTATSATTAGTVTTAAQPNITSVGTLSSLSVTGNVTSSANISGSYILGNGSQLTGIVSSYGNANVAAYLASGSDTSNIITTGNITGGNLITSGTNGSISGVNYLYANVVSANSVTTSGKVISGAVSYTNVDGTSGQILTTYGNGQTYFSNPAASTYGNSNVATFMAAYGSNTISTTGNITGGNLIGTIATASQPGITTIGTLGSLSVTGNITTAGNVVGNIYAPTTLGTGGIYGRILTASQPNITVVGTLSSLSVTGNISGGNVSLTGQLAASGNITASGNIQGTSLILSGGITATDSALTIGDINMDGNIIMNGAAGGGTSGANIDYIGGGGYARFYGNVSAVAGYIISGGVTYARTDGTAGQVLTTYGNGQTYFSTVGSGSYGNSNVNTLLASWGSNTLSTTGNVATGNLTATGNIYGTNIGTKTKIYTDGAGFNAYGTNDATSGAYVTNGGGNILIGAHPSSGVLLMTEYGTTNRTMSWNNSNLAVAGNISASFGNIICDRLLGTTAGNIQALVGVVIAGNVQYTNVDGTAGQVLTTYGNGKTYFSTVSGGSPAGSSLELQFNNGGVFGGVPGTAYYAGNGRLSLAGATFEQSGSNSIVSVPGTGGYVSVTGNVTAGNLIATGTVKSGAVTITGTDGTNGQVLTTYGNGVTYFSTVSGGGGSPGGSNTQLQFNDAGSFAGNANMSFDKTTGNIGFGNLVIGNIGTSGTFYNVLTNKNQFLGNTTNMPSNARVLVGSGRNGDWSTTADVNNNSRDARFVVSDEYIKADNGIRTSEFASLSFANLNGSTTFGSANTNSRIQGVVSDLVVHSGNTASTNVGMIRAAAIGTLIGTGTNTGNANLAHAVGISSFITVNTGSTGGNIFGFHGGTTGSGVANTQVGFAIQLSANANGSGNAYGILMPSNTSTYGVNGSNIARGATNYYFLRNEDALAKNQINQMNRYWDGLANCGGSSGGAVTINASNGQFQYLNVTEDVTSISFTNFSTFTTNTSGSPVPFADTVTLLINQDATGRTITMPTTAGNTTYKYAAGGNTVGTTANSVTMISITAVPNLSNADPIYLITISPEFS